MVNHYPDLAQKIADMAEGDKDFREQLTQAIYEGIKELKEKYKEGQENADLKIIQEIRHKIKPTLILFGFEDLIEFMDEGKAILSESGFGSKFDDHTDEIQTKLNQALSQLESLK